MLKTAKHLFLPVRTTLHIRQGPKAGEFCTRDLIHGKPCTRAYRHRPQVAHSSQSSGLQAYPGRIISSLNNPFVKHCSKLRTNGRYRLEEGAAILAGIVPLLELRREVPGLDIRALLWSGARDAIPEELEGLAKYYVTDDVLKKVSGLQTVNGLYAIAELALPREADFAGLPKGQLHRLLVLDGVQDPGNMGTLMRTALALGWQGAFFLEGCCDPFNDKALRASRGATFKLPIAFGSWNKLHTILTHHGMTCYAAETQSAEEGTLRGSGKEPNKRQQKKAPDAKPLALVLGAEGQGLSDIARNNSQAVCIPMNGAMESLCVSQAGAILLFLLGKGSPCSLSQLGGMLQTNNDISW